MQAGVVLNKEIIVNGNTSFASWKKDRHIMLFFLNTAMVIIGYGLAAPTGFASVGPMKLLRIILIGISLVLLFNSRKNYQYIFSGKSSWIMWVFIALNIYIMPFSANIYTSIEKLINLVPYFIYLNYFIIYLNRMYDKQFILNTLINIINIVYAIPVVSYLLSGSSFNQEDIYGEVVGGFVSNHYGWSSSIFLATSLDVLRNNPAISKVRRLATILGCIAACYLLAISGSRSGYLTFILCFMIFILRNGNTSLFLKMMSTIIAVYFIAQLYANKDSALNKRIQKTETQLEKGEARGTVYRLGFQTMVENPGTLVTGFGFYAFKDALFNLNKNVTAKQLRINLHNSYYELLFGTGFLVFTFFMLFFVLRSSLYFFLYHSSKYVFLPPILLIPLFENNFNPGQFLFFPWFIIMFYYIYYKEKQIRLSDKPYSTETNTN